MYRLPFLILLCVFLRLLAPTEASAYVPGTSEPDYLLGSVEFQHPAKAEADPYLLGISEADYVDYAARAAWQPKSNAPPRERIDSLTKHHSGSRPGISSSAPLQSRDKALELPGILPPRLDHPPYYATAPPSPR
ncbi:hypothetical protein BH23GEM7_BH23GEM7_07990 [soil metagenome]|nr:hypothetical protein [Gemmatimonadota bacterium]